MMRMSIGWGVALLAVFAVSGASAGDDARRAEMVRYGVPSSLLAWASWNARADWDSVDAEGRLGAFGLSVAASLVAGREPARLLRSPRLQVRVWTARQQRHWEAVRRLGLTALLGRDVCDAGRCVRLTPSSLLAACRTGCETPGSRLGRFMQSGDCEQMDAADVSVCRDLVWGAGYDVREITGEQ